MLTRYIVCLRGRENERRVSDSRFIPQMSMTGGLHWIWESKTQFRCPTGGAGAPVTGAIAIVCQSAHQQAAGFRPKAKTWPGLKFSNWLGQMPKSMTVRSCFGNVLACFEYSCCNSQTQSKFLILEYRLCMCVRNVWIQIPAALVLPHWGSFQMMVSNDFSRKLAWLTGKRGQKWKSNLGIWPLVTEMGQVSCLHRQRLHSIQMRRQRLSHRDQIGQIIASSCWVLGTWCPAALGDHLSSNGANASPTTPSLSVVSLVNYPSTAHSPSLWNLSVLICSSAESLLSLLKK